MIRLLGLIEEHHSALRFDFRHFYNLSIDGEWGVEFGVSDALDLIDELEYERSHYAAAKRAWTRPASWPDLFG